MHKLDQKGELLIPLIVVGVLLFVSLGFGAWAFFGRQDYKDNVDKKIDEAVEVAQENLRLKKDAEFAEAYKLPNTTYQGPSSLGTLTIVYPKTWSNYVDTANGGTPLNGFMHPSYVSANVNDTNFAFRYQVVERQYDQEAKTIDSRVKSGRTKVTAYRLPNQESVLGSRIEGELEARKQGLMVMLPLRDKTIKIWTEGDDFRSDFESILKQLKFIP